MKIINVLAFLMLLSILITCKKSESQLPPATHNGANILACLVNGKPFISSGLQNNVISLGVIFDVYSDSTAWLDATTDDPHFELSISSKFNFSLTTFSFGPDYFTNGAVYYVDTNGTLPTGGNTFSTDSLHTGSVTYTYYDGNILAGTFHFDAVNANGQVLHITEGRFDIANH